MGLLDDAIRDHLDLKRRHGAAEQDVARLEQEALGPPRRGEVPEPLQAAPVVDEAPVVEEAPEPAPEPVSEAPQPSSRAPERTVYADEPWLEDATSAPAQASTGGGAYAAPAPEPEPNVESGDDDVLEETPEFLQETPEHDRLWFEQKPPKDFDFDK